MQGELGKNTIIEGYLKMFFQSLTEIKISLDKNNDREE